MTTIANCLRSVRGCRPFSAENDPPDRFPGAPNPLDPFAPHPCMTFGKETEKSNSSAPASESMPNETGPEGFQRAIGKPFGRARRREIPFGDRFRPSADHGGGGRRRRWRMKPAGSPVSNRVIVDDDNCELCFAVAPWTPSHPFSCLFSVKQEKKVTLLPRYLGNTAQSGVAEKQDIWYNRIMDLAAKKAGPFGTADVSRFVIAGIVLRSGRSSAPGCQVLLRAPRKCGRSQCTSPDRT